MSTARRRVRLAAEIGSFVLTSLVFGVVVEFAIDLRDNTFLWTVVVVIGLVGAACVRVAHDDLGFLLRRRGRVLVVGAAALAALTGTAVWELTRPPEPVCLTRRGADVVMGGLDPRVGRAPATVAVCPTFGNANVVKSPASPVVVARLRPAREVWVVCYKRGGDGQVWYYTQGDVQRAEPHLHAWGYPAVGPAAARPSRSGDRALPRPHPLARPAAPSPGRSAGSVPQRSPRGGRDPLAWGRRPRVRGPSGSLGAMGDGNGWTRCAAGHVHWGRYGAAGLLAYHRDPAGGVHVLLQQRAWWTPGGRTWGLLGGACDSHEDGVAAALREAAEESTADARDFRIHGVRRDDHGGWWYDTVIASAPRMTAVGPASAETKAVEWVPVDEVDRRPLFRPFAATWPALRASLERLVLVVDAANVVGSRPDGWWRDRAGATVRLRDRLAKLAATGVAGLPEEVDDAPSLDRWYPEIILIVEGAARVVAEAGEAASPGVRVVAADGSGDDTIAATARAAPPDARTLVVTADRELRARCRAEGAAVVGPRWLLSLL